MIKKDFELFLWNHHAKYGAIVSRQAYQFSALGFDIFLSQMNWRDIWLWHVAVIIGFFLATLRSGFTSIIIPATGFLNHFFAIIQQFFLPVVFVFDSHFDGAERIEVLNFSTRAQFSATFFSERNIHIKTHITIIEVAISHTSKGENTPKFFTIIPGIFLRVNIWHGDNLDQWGVGAVQVDETIGIKMRELTSITFKVSMFDANFRTVR